MTRWAPPLVLLGACVAGAGTEPWPAAGSVAVFAEEAQPVLAARCANPSCHGTAARPLSLYAVHRHRLDEDDDFLDAPLSDEELAHNLRQVSRFLVGVDEAARSLLLTKPLSGHAGVEVFHDARDHDYRRLHAWIESVLAEGGAP